MAICKSLISILFIPAEFSHTENVAEKLCQSPAQVDSAVCSTNDLTSDVMHTASYSEMRRTLGVLLAPLREHPLVVLDVGSKVANKGSRVTYRELMATRWTYIGTDIETGDNVDLVMSGPYNIPLERETVDVVISGQCLEHVEAPWLLIREMARVLKPEGHMVVTAPAVWPEHRYPKDCYRFYPDAIRYLLEVEAGLVSVDAWAICHRYVFSKRQELDVIDCWGHGQKPESYDRELCVG